VPLVIRRTGAGGLDDGVSNVMTPTLCTRQQKIGKPLGLIGPNPSGCRSGAFAIPQDRQNRVKRCGALAHQLD
jgi:hypothetical protein